MDLAGPLRDWRRRSLNSSRGPDCDAALAAEDLPLCTAAQARHAELVTALDEDARPAVLGERAMALADAAARATRALRFRYMRTAGEAAGADEGAGALRRQVEQLRGPPPGRHDHDEHDEHAAAPGSAGTVSSASPVQKYENPYARLINGYAAATMGALRLAALLVRHSGPEARVALIIRIEAFYLEHPEASRTPFEEAALREEDPAIKARLRAVLRPAVTAPPPMPVLSGPPPPSAAPPVGPPAPSGARPRPAASP